MPNSNLPLIDKEEELKIASKVIRAISHPLRKQILIKLDEKSGANVTDLYMDLKIEQSVASQHLKILRDAKIVEARRKGKSVVYQPNYDKLSKLEKIVTQIITEIISD